MVQIWSVIHRQRETYSLNKCSIASNNYLVCTREKKSNIISQDFWGSAAFRGSVQRSVCTPGNLLPVMKCREQSQSYNHGGFMEIWQGFDVKIYVLLRASQVVLRALGISQTSPGSFAPSSAPGGGEFCRWNAGTPQSLCVCVFNFVSVCEFSFSSWGPPGSHSGLFRHSRCTLISSVPPAAV